MSKAAQEHFPTNESMQRLYDQYYEIIDTEMDLMAEIGYTPQETIEALLAIIKTIHHNNPDETADAMDNIAAMLEATGMNDDSSSEEEDSEEESEEEVEIDTIDSAVDDSKS